MDNSEEVKKFYEERLTHRTELIENELKTCHKAEPQIESQSEDFESASDPLTLEEEKEKSQPPALNKKESDKIQRDFDKTLTQAQRQGSIVVEKFDFTDMKKVLRERLINYKQAIDYCIQIDQEKSIIKDLVSKAEIIKQFIDTYDKRNEGEQLELIFKLPRDVTPEDVLGDAKKTEFVKYIQYIEKLMPQIKQEKIKNMKIYKKQKDPISKENFQQLVKLEKDQEEIKQQLTTLAGNRWQPLPEIHISEHHFSNPEFDDKTSGKYLYE